jgi:hypothetical protein
MSRPESKENPTKETKSIPRPVTKAESEPRIVSISVISPEDVGIKDLKRCRIYGLFADIEDDRACI